MASVYEIALMRLLITGFEPFAGNLTNPSQKLIEDLRHDPILAKDCLFTVLPVSYRRAPEKVHQILLANPTVDRVLMFGLAQMRTKMSLERVALNWTEARLADVDGVMPAPGRLLPGAEEVRLNPLPLREWADDLEKMGLPVEVSLSAGGYVCNALAYAVSGLMKSRGEALFVHLPTEETLPLSQMRQAALYLQKALMSLSSKEIG